MGIVLDTDVCIGILNGLVKIDDFTSKHGDEKIFITSSTIFELYRGLFKRFYSKNAISQTAFEKERNKLKLFISQFIELSYNGKAAEISTRLFEQLRGRGEDIGMFDCQIAGTMLSHKMRKILTWNKKHFEKLSELEIHTP